MRMTTNNTIQKYLFVNIRIIRTFFDSYVYLNNTTFDKVNRFYNLGRELRL